MQRKDRDNVLKYIIATIKPFKSLVAIHFFVVFFFAIDVSLWPFLSKLLIDKVAVTSSSQMWQTIWPFALGLIALTISGGLVWRLADYAWSYLDPLMKKKIVLDAGDKMLDKSQNFYQNNLAGACANRIRELANNTPKLLEMIIYNFISVGLILVIAFFTILQTHKFFAITLVIWSALFIYMAIRAAKLTDKMSSDLAVCQAKIMGNFVDVLTNIQNVKFFTNQQKERERFAFLQNRYSVFFKRRGFFLLKFFTIHGLTFSLYFSLSIVALIYFYIENEVTLGDFTLIFTINCFVINSMWNSANQMRTFLEELGAVKQALRMINRPLEIKDDKNAVNLKILGDRGAEVIFDNVRFSYELLARPSSDFKPTEVQPFAKCSPKNSVLTDKGSLAIRGRLVINRGEKIGLVGHSGSGKTTFINLLMRSYDVNFGVIEIDGQNVEKVTQNSLRRAITIIPQDPLLFHRTLFDNIAYARNDATLEEVERAAKLAHCDQFIEKLSCGYQTLVGDRGIKLSGGQRQRIAIARAFLEDAPILIMDESTSQLDSITENLIQEGLQNLMNQKTTFIVAHRLATLQNVDRILVFDEGQIVEAGTHQELLDYGGIYYKMYNKQINGFFSE
jgi:ATP-binding cassette subfamily B protein